MRVASARSTRSASIAGALILLTLGAARAETVRILNDPLVEAGGQFGHSLAAVGDLLAIGAPGTRELGEEGAGAVHLFDTDGRLRRTLTATNPVAGAALGAAMAATDTRLFVGAPGDRPLGVGGLGAVYVFDAATDAPIRVIRAPDPDASTLPVGGRTVRVRIPSNTTPLPVAAGFGRALAVAGGVLAVGAPESRVDGVDGAGAVYVLDTEGVPLLALREFPARAHASFGAALALADGLLFVGAPGATSPGGVDAAGEVLVFNAGTGALLRRLDATITNEGAALGTSIRELGGALFVGAPGESVVGVEGAGAVHSFDARTGALGRTIVALTPARDAGFGSTLGGIDEDLLVAAPGADVAGIEGAGAVFRFPSAGDAAQTLTPTRPVPGGHFGLAVAAFGPAVAIGEPAPGTGAAGSVYLFDAALPSSTGSSALREPTGTTGPLPIATGCPQSPTVDSLDCRLSELLSIVSYDPRIARPLRRTRNRVRRAYGAHALLEGRRQMEIVVRRLERSRARPDAAIEAARAIGADLGTLARSTSR